MSFLRPSSGKYHVSKIQKSRLNPNDNKTKIVKISEFDEIQEITQQPKIENFTIKLTYLKQKANAIELQILADLNLLQNLHKQEIEILTQQFRKQDITAHQQLRNYLNKQQKHIEKTVQNYINEIITLDPISTRQIEKKMKKMLEKLGQENDEIIWVSKPITQKWKKLVRKLVKPVFK